MDSIVNETLESESEENKSSSNVGMTDEEIAEIAESLKTEICVIGCGGAGCNTVDRIAKKDFDDAELVAINTDAQDLNNCQADTKLLVGQDTCHGRGAGNDPDKGQVAARENIDKIEKLLEDKDMVFITAGMGGGTGTGVAPVVASVAKEKCLTVSVVTTPFEAEGKKRLQNAKVGIDKLKDNSDTVLFISNDNLVQNVPNMPMEKAFKMADTVLMRCVTEIVNIIKNHNLVNLDFADVSAIMKNGGIGMIGLGESEDSNAEECVSKALESPLLDVDVSEANSVLVNITGGKDMQVEEAQSVVKKVQNEVDEEAKIIWGAGTYSELDGTIRTMVLITGVDEINEPEKENEDKEFESSVETKDTGDSQSEDEESTEIIEASESLQDNNEDNNDIVQSDVETDDDKESGTQGEKSTIDFFD